MILIAHRGNTFGKSNRENHPDYIQVTLNQGYHIEVDVWYAFGKFSLGHDEPLYVIKKDFLKNLNIWCHAKTITTLKYLLDLGANCFFHDKDDVTLTSNGYIWTYPGKSLTTRSICVLPEKDFFPDKCAGICSDYISIYNK
jgi:hypothetical protein